MKNVITVLALIALFLDTAIAVERPSDADLQAFKIYHHAVYLVTTAAEAGEIGRASCRERVLRLV